MFRVYLMNFGWDVHQGSYPGKAKAEVERVGFESAVYKDDVLDATYSPIHGWRVENLHAQH